jgi:hypothetical protein
MSLITTCPIKDIRVTANPIDDIENNSKVTTTLLAIR